MKLLTRSRRGGKRKETKRLLLIGYFDRGNFGDNLMHEAARLLVRNRRHNVDLKSMALPSFELRNYARALQFLHELLRADEVILAGGTHLHDAYGRQTWRVLATHFLVYAIAKVGNARVGLAGIGLGPIDSRLAQGLIRASLGIVDSIMVRDQISHQHAARLTDSRKTVRGYDLATVLDVPLPHVPAHPIIGISILPYFEVWAGKAGMDDQVLRALTTSFVELSHCYTDLEVRVLVFCDSRHGDDTTVSKELWSRLTQGGVNVSLRRCIEYDDATREVSQLTGFIAWRYHAAMLGFLNNLPLAIVSYHEKCAGLADEIGLEKRALLQPLESLDSKRWHDLLVGMVERPDSFRPSCRKDELKRETTSAFEHFLHNLESRGIPL
jgi:polysaccharide pyruvyl transferase WcaK-like protein